MIRERLLLPRIPQAERPVYVLVATWVLAMISIPIVRWTLGDDALPAGISLGVLLQVIAVSLVVIGAWGVRRGLLTLGVIVALAWLIEYIGSTTGFPFGSYDYTPRLQPQIGGVPLLVPLAWLMMLPPAWAVAQIIVGTRGVSSGLPSTEGRATAQLTKPPPHPSPEFRGERSSHGRKHESAYSPPRIRGGAGGGVKKRMLNSLALGQGTPRLYKLRFILVSALAFTAWDLFLDPQMVAWDLWRWADPGALSYFGIPFANYAGWLLASVVITWIAAQIAPIRRLPARPLLIIYAITWALETIGLAVFWGLPAPALVGCAGMGALLLWTWRASKRAAHE